MSESQYEAFEVLLDWVDVLIVVLVEDAVYADNATVVGEVPISIQIRILSS